MRALEAIARYQPIGLTALSEATGDDKSSLQRTLATLHEEGWTQPTPGPPPQWELSTKALVLAELAEQSRSLSVRARQLVDPLRDETKESVHLSLLDQDEIVVAKTAQSPQVVRTAVQVGEVHPYETSAAGRAIMAHLSPRRRAELAQNPQNLLSAAEFDLILNRDWARSDGAVIEGSNSVAAAIVDSSGAPIGALVISGPATRLTPERMPELGEMLANAVKSLKAQRAPEW